MQRIFRAFCLAAPPLILGLLVSLSNSEQPGGKTSDQPRKATGIDKRVPWITSKVDGSPEPPNPYQLTPTYPKLTFDEPLELMAVPGRKMWLIAERQGKIYAFDADPAKAEKKLVLDVGHTVYGIAIHPDFQKNGYIYVSHVPLSDKETDGTHISRFTAKDPAALVADPKSEKVILTWKSGGHNGGCLRFGPDGYLYISTGDGSGIADSLETGQNIGDLLGSILRIDVDHADAGKGYRIPADNPFVDRAEARGEVWAYGIRQSWKIAHDPATGVLWAGEVGQDLWESVLRIEKGGNYGWSVSEGTHPFRPERKKGPTPILKPVVEHNHAEFRSITGGYVYHGKKHPDLKDAYIYGDYDTGRVWLLRYDEKEKKVTDHRELAKSTLRIVAWGQDAEGEVYALDFIRGTIYHLEAAPAPTGEQAKFPRKLSETGLFASLKDLKPAAGVIPYSVNSELWSDGAIKERYLALPGDSKIEFETVTYPQPAPGSVPGWRFPDNTVLVKTFSLEMEKGNPASKRRLETRILHVRRVPGTEEVGDQVWNGYTYIWNDDQTDAELADAKGVDRTYTIKEPAGERKQTWHFPSRTECTMCHTVTAKYALGVNTAQMNRDHDYEGGKANQLATFDHLGLFDRKLPATPDKLAKLADYRDTTASLDSRARAYLQANCSHCHRKWGGGNADFQLLFTLPLKDTGTVDIKPAHGAFDLKDPRLLAPGAPERSLLYHRMTRLGLGRMPHIASNVVDEEGIKLIEAWIREMK
ncbi:PQQ-dependent sugar dehydrogenase [Zavarzinella formosa]|uniref:PQQ-dependent sugar dehydrogenase n=1 Tax=Zavarzinella formosa TaxID=360055 RepID=UPI0003168F2A|nr:PQQ-dependent sugar dehydrogenase [Zavarzinella formosa]